MNKISFRNVTIFVVVILVIFYLFASFVLTVSAKVNPCDTVDSNVVAAYDGHTGDEIGDELDVATRHCTFDGNNEVKAKHVHEVKSVETSTPIVTPPAIVPTEITPPATETPNVTPVTTETPSETSTPEVKSKHPNSGRGNGSELDSNGDDIDPGKSQEHNQGGD